MVLIGDCSLLQKASLLFSREGQGLRNARQAVRGLTLQHSQNSTARRQTKQHCHRNNTQSRYYELGWLMCRLPFAAPSPLLVALQIFKDPVTALAACVV
jgi:hypothetical protein